MTDQVVFAGFTSLVLAILFSLAHFSHGVLRAEGTGPDALGTPAALGDGTSDSDSRATTADDPVLTAAESDETDWSAELGTVSLTSFSVDSTDASPHPEPSTPTGAGVAGDVHIDVDTGPESNSDQATSPGITATLVSAVSERSASTGDLLPHLLLANVAFSQAFLGGFFGLGAWYADVPAVTLGPSAADPPVQFAVGVGFGPALYGANRVGSTINEWFGVVPGEATRESLTSRTTADWVLPFAVTLPLIAGFEELLFRDVLAGAIIAGFDVSPQLIAAMSSVVPSARHGAQDRLGIIVTGLLGFVLAAAFVLTESPLVVVAAHYLVNTLESASHELSGWQWDLSTSTSITAVEPPAVTAAARECVQVSVPRIAGANIGTRQLTQAGPVSYLVLVVAVFITRSPTLRLAADAIFELAAVLLGIATLRIPVDSQLKCVASDGSPLTDVSQSVELAAGVQSVGPASVLFLLVGLFGYLAPRREVDAMLF